MKKLTRFVIVLIVLAICYYFLNPSIQWYKNTSEDQQKLALMSREDIRDFSNAQAEKLYNEMAADTAVEQAEPAEVKTEAAETAENAEAAETVAVVDPYAGVKEALKASAVKKYNADGKEVPAVMNGKAVVDAYADKAAFVEEAKSLIGKQILKNKGYYSNAVKLGLDLNGGTNLIVQAKLDQLEIGENQDASEAKKTAMTQAVESLSTRLDKFGLSSPVIRQQGDDRIYIELPGEEKSDSINAIINSGSALTFHLVNKDATNLFNNAFNANPSDFIDQDTGKLKKDSVTGALNVASIANFPSTCSVYAEYKKDEFQLDVLTGFWAVNNEVVMDGSRVKTVDVGQNQDTKEIEVNFHLDSDGAVEFAQFTSANVGQMLAIVSDGAIRSAANIKGAIPGGNVSLTGAFNRDEANNIKKVLQSPALNVPLELETSQHVDASMGKNAQKEGMEALLFGLALVLVFMIIYYKGAGVNALLAQVLNMYIMFAVLSAFNLTLTLSSIAGMILTVGMSVDANVIIFERIKEELRAGKSRAAAISMGFDNAFWAIMDSNITTFIAAIFMAKLGTGAIQGFAVSLAIGVVSSVFTALVVSRLLFDFNTETLHKTKTSISWRIK